MNGNDSTEPEWSLDTIIRSVFDNIPGGMAVIGGIVLVLLVGLLLSKPWVRVDRDQEAVILRFGKFSRVLGPGLHWKMPAPVEKSYLVNTQRVFSEAFGYREGSSGNWGYKEEALMLTGDLGVARVEWDVQYTKSNPKKYLFNIRNEKKILRDASLAAMRRVVGDYAATKVITTARQIIQRKVKDELQRIMDSYRSGIRIADVIIQQSEPPQPVKPAFNEVNSARQDREKIRNQALRKKEQVLNKAEGRVQQMLSEAQGDSAAIINRAKGDARYFNKILSQYQAAPRVTETRMFLETMKKVLKKSDRVYVVDDKVKSILPMMRLKGQGSR